ncbi:MAG: hypothetical protein E6J79_00635, partial [Deltaproteobacteria bacterium]
PRCSPSSTPAENHTEERALDARLLAALERRARPTALSELLRAARIERGLRNEAAERVSALEATGRLVRTRGDRYALPARLHLVGGRLTVHRDGFAFCVPDDPEESDVYVPARAVRPAMHGDRV